MKDKRVLVLDAVHNHVLTLGQTAISGAEILITGTPDIGEAGKLDETGCKKLIEWMTLLIFRRLCPATHFQTSLYLQHTEQLSAGKHCTDKIISA